MATTSAQKAVVTENTNPVLVGFEDDAGKTAMATIFGDAVSSERIDDCSINFHYGLSYKHDVNNLSTGTGSSSVVGSDARVSCGAGVGSGYIESRDAIRYRAGHEAFAYFTADISELQVGVNTYIGPLDEEDAACFGSQGTEFGIWFVENSTPTFIAQSSWSEDVASWLDPTKRNLFMVTYGYLGIAPIIFRIYGGKERGWQTVHIIDLTNSQTEGHLKNPTLPIGMRVERTSGSGASVNLTTGSWNAGTVGGGQVADRWVVIGETRVNLGSQTGNTYENMFTVRNKSAFNGKPNHIRVELAVANFTTDANKSVEFVNIVGGTLSGNTAFVDVDANESVLEVSYNGTVTGTAAGAATTVTKVSDRRTDVRGTDIYIYPGEEVSLGVRGVAGQSVTGDISATFRYVQEF